MYRKFLLSFQINQKLFYGESSNDKSKFVCVWDKNDSDQDPDDLELVDSGDEYLTQDAEVSQMRRKLCHQPKSRN